MIPTPIRQVLSTFQAHGVQALLMGGQACVFYGAAQVSKDVDVVLLGEPGNFARLERALDTLAARRIAVPPLDRALLARGHAVHFRCAAPGVEELRVDIMTRLTLQSRPRRIESPVGKTWRTSEAFPQNRVLLLRRGCCLLSVLTVSRTGSGLQYAVQNAGEQLDANSESPAGGGFSGSQLPARTRSNECRIDLEPSPSRVTRR